MAQIQFANITKKFGAKVAVNDISFSCKDGEFLTIIGQAGAGKTTILNMLAGIVKPTSGDIYIDGKRVNDLPIQDRDIAMAFEGYNLYPHMSVYDRSSEKIRIAGWASRNHVLDDTIRSPRCRTENIDSDFSSMTEHPDTR